MMEISPRSKFLFLAASSEHQATGPGFALRGKAGAVRNAEFAADHNPRFVGKQEVGNDRSQAATAVASVAIRGTDPLHELRYPRESTASSISAAVFGGPVTVMPVPLAPGLSL